MTKQESLAASPRIRPTQAGGNLKRPYPAKPVYLQIMEQIQELIETGDLVLGDQLLSERELADRLQVSRTSVRRALAELVGMRVIEVSPRNGAYVRRTVAPDDDSDRLVQILLRDQDQVTHLFEARQMLEAQAVRLAAVRRDDADLQRLWELYHDIEKNVQQRHPPHHSDVLFHIAIVESAKNPVLTQWISTLTTVMNELFSHAWLWVLSASPAEAPHYTTDHKEILLAIADGDADRATELLSKHLQHAYQIWKTHCPRPH